MKKIILLVSIIALAQYTNAQSPLLDSAKNELYRVNKIFDSAQYIGFNLNIVYKSDSANVTIETDQMDGNYVLNQHNMYYHMGTTIYVQTDSFAYNIYPEEQTIMMTKNFIAQSSNAFPLRNFVDSMVYNYANDYTVTITTIPADSFNKVKRIRFNKIPLSDSSANDPVGMQYNYFYIDYNFGVEGKYEPIKFEFSYDEEAQSITLDSLGNNTNPNTYLATRTVTMNFSNFKPELNFELFNDASYVFYNRQRKIYEPTGKYRDYQFTSAGFDNEDDDAEDYREVPPIRN
jgi:hypothetical protein